MRFFLSILFTALAAWILTCTFGWAMIAVAGLCWGPVASSKPGRCFWSAFLGIFLLWSGVGLWRDVANDHLLSGRLAQIFFVQNGYLFLLVAALIGGLVGGLSGWTGALIYRLLLRSSSKS